MDRRRLRHALAAASGTVGVLLLSGSASAGSSDLAQTMPLVWVMTVLSVGGSVVTFGIMVWALWKFRDRKAKELGYG